MISIDWPSETDTCGRCVICSIALQLLLFPCIHTGLFADEDSTVKAVKLTNVSQQSAGQPALWPARASPGVSAGKVLLQDGWPRDIT